MKTTLKPRTTARAEDTRKRIYEAALELFRENGFEQTTMRDIAQKAGVALGAAYYYFASKEAIVGTYQALDKAAHKHILLDFKGVEYLNSSGIALVIQVLMEASKSGQTIAICGLTPHFTKVFTMVGITKYAGLYPGQQEALAAL